jgi:uncharacterized protein DUF6445
VRLHQDIRIARLTIGTEKAPLLVIDNFVSDADELVANAASKPYAASMRYFPGVRSKASLAYQQLFDTELKPTLLDFFGLQGTTLRFGMCHYSLITTPADKLATLQRIPHVDSLGWQGLATIHYLFRKKLGGTAFYRHRKTGFEYLDEARQETYLQCLVRECDGPDAPAAEYINGDTALFEQIAKQEGLFNRLLVYRRNSLHSGCIGRDFVPDANPLSGRLSINCFIDVAR